MLKTFALCLFLITPIGCASTGGSSSNQDDGRAVQTGTFGLEDLDEGNTAHGAAFLVDAINIRTPMPSRSNWKPMEFYYKHCTEIGARVDYSKSSYECSGPY